MEPGRLAVGKSDWLLNVHPMELKTARLTVLMDPEKKLALEKVCAEQDVTPSQVVRRLIRDYIAQHAGGGRRGSGRRSPGPV